jgi:molecular chaperone GrpE
MTEPTENTAPLHPNSEWSAAPDAAALEAQIAELRVQLAAAQEAQLRIAAEAENSRRRIEREAQATARYASERLIGELITVADALELGLQAATAPGAEVKALAEGMQMTYRQLMAVLEKHGLRQLNPVGEKLNPAAHQAVSTAESAEVPANHVLTVMQRGYQLHERVIRPAMVVVARAPAAAEPPAS